MTDDPYNLQRFIDAQDPVFSRILQELRAGRKTTHWMWFIFPQLKGLGHSALAEKFGIASLDEAVAYLSHPILGARLRDCTRLVLQAKEKSIHEIFGSPDDLKFRSCMTLFAQCSAETEVFTQALKRYFDGQPDPKTIEPLGRR